MAGASTPSFMRVSQMSRALAMCSRTSRVFQSSGAGDQSSLSSGT